MDSRGLGSVWVCGEAWHCGHVEEFGPLGALGWQEKEPCSGEGMRLPQAVSLLWCLLLLFHGYVS